MHACVTCVLDVLLFTFFGMYCVFFSGPMFLQPQRGAVRLVVSDGSAQRVQGGADS